MLLVVFYYCIWDFPCRCLNTSLCCVTLSSVSVSVSDLGFPARGTMCPSQQLIMSEGHFSFGRGTIFFFILMYQGF